MDGHFDHSDGFEDLEDRLRTARPQLSALELDAIKLNTMRRAVRRPAHSSKGSFMRARMTILATLVVGMMMMGTGGALAVSGLSAGTSASHGQYGPVSGGGQGGVLGRQTDSCSNPSGSGSGSGNSGSSTGSGERCGGGTGTVAAVQTNRQTSSGGKSLPFTGFLAIPVLLIGMALLGTGFVMRRKTRDDLS